MKYVLILLFSFSLIKGSAQSLFTRGYIILNTNDTITGLIDYRSSELNTWLCRFRESEHAPVVEYRPGEIAGYRFQDGKYYVSRTVGEPGTERNLFLEYILNGTVDLYFYSENSNPYFLIESKEGDLVQLYNEVNVLTNEYQVQYEHASKKYIGQLKYIFADFPEAHSRIDNLTLNNKNLIDLIKRYHEHVYGNTDYVLYEKKETKVRAVVSPVFSHEWLNMKTNGESLYNDFRFKGTGLSAGVLLHLTLPYINEKLSAELALMGGRSNLYGNISSQGSSVVVTEKRIDLKYNYLKSHLLLSYTWPKGRLRPLLAAGIGYNYVLSEEKTEIWNRFLSGEYYDSQEKECNLPDNKRELGFSIGSGLVYELPGDRKITFRSLYQKSYTFISPAVNMAFSGIAVQAGISINK